MAGTQGESNIGANVETALTLGDESLVPTELVQEWLYAIFDSDRYDWKAPDGGPITNGFAEVVSGRVANAIGKCDREGGCLLGITTEGIYGSGTGQSTVLLECALKSLAKGRAIPSEESECRTHHSQAGTKLAKHITTSLRRLDSARQALEDAEIAIQEAEQAL